MVSQTIPGGRGLLSRKGSWRIHCPVKGWGTICRTRGQAGKARLKGHNLQPSRSATVVEVKVFLRFGGTEICQEPLLREELGFPDISCIPREVQLGFPFLHDWPLGGTSVLVVMTLYFQRSYQFVAQIAYEVEHQ